MEGVAQSHLSDHPFQRHFEWLSPGIEPFPGERRQWSYERLVSGQMLRFDRVDELPPEAEAERRSCHKRGVKSLLALPVHTPGRFSGVSGFETMRQERHWSDHEVTRLQLIGEILTTALERRRTEAALRESEAKLQQSQKLEEETTGIRTMVFTDSEQMLNFVRNMMAG